MWYFYTKNSIFFPDLKLPGKRDGRKAAEGPARFGSGFGTASHVTLTETLTFLCLEPAPLQQGWDQLSSGGTSVLPAKGPTKIALSEVSKQDVFKIRSLQRSLFLA